MKKILLVLAVLILSVNLFAQDETVNGKLTVKGNGVLSGGTPYGDFGDILFNANTGYSSGARRYLLTNRLSGGTEFAIIQSVDANTTPTLGDAGVITSGTAMLRLRNTGHIYLKNLFTEGSATINGNITATGTYTGSVVGPNTAGLKLINITYNANGISLRPTGSGGSAHGFTLWDEQLGSAFLSYNYGIGLITDQKVGIHNGNPENALDITLATGDGIRLGQIDVGLGTTHKYIGLNDLGTAGCFAGGAWLSFDGDNSGNYGLTIQTQEYGIANHQTVFNYDGSVNFGGNITASGEITATKFIGDGSGLTGISGSSKWTEDTGKLYYNDGNIGLGTTIPENFHSDANNLVIYENGSHGGLTIATPGAPGSLYFADGTNGNEAYRGYISYNHSTDALRLGTGAVDRLTIDASGNLTAAGDVSFGNRLSAGSLRITGNQINEIGADANTQLWLNFVGYQEGTTQFRDTRIGDGKTNEVALFKGSDRSLTVNGEVTATKFIGDGSGLTGISGTSKWTDGDAVMLPPKLTEPS